MKRNRRKRPNFKLKDLRGHSKSSYRQTDHNGLSHFEDVEHKILKQSDPEFTAILAGVKCTVLNFANEGKSGWGT